MFETVWVCMGTSYAKVYLHFVWGTYRRRPLIDGKWKRRLLRCIAAEARKLGCSVLAINGVEDHVHVLVWAPLTVAPSMLAKQMKGASSRFISRVEPGAEGFRWQSTYAVFSVDRHLVPRVMGYIRKQEAHHAHRRRSATPEPPLPEAPAEPAPPPPLGGTEVPPKEGLVPRPRPTGD
ncbi:MAG: IS200/IS605 family transposase [Armatimonadota bacterium]